MELPLTDQDKMISIIAHHCNLCFEQSCPAVQGEDAEVPGGGGGGDAEQHDVRAVIVPQGGGPSET